MIDQKSPSIVGAFSSMCIYERLYAHMYIWRISVFFYDFVTRSIAAHELSPSSGTIIVAVSPTAAL